MQRAIAVFFSQLTAQADVLMLASKTYSAYTHSPYTCQMLCTNEYAHAPCMHTSHSWCTRAHSSRPQITRTYMHARQENKHRTSKAWYTQSTDTTLTRTHKHTCTCVFVQTSAGESPLCSCQKDHSHEDHMQAVCLHLSDSASCTLHVVLCLQSTPQAPVHTHTCTLRHAFTHQHTQQGLLHACSCNLLQPDVDMHRGHACVRTLHRKCYSSEREHVRIALTTKSDGVATCVGHVPATRAA
jgi:hypothetical protein